MAWLGGEEGVTHMSRIEKVCIGVTAVYFGGLLLLITFLIVNQFVSGHALDTVLFMSRGGSSSSW